MPRYPFACPACGLEFEVSRPMSEAGRPAACPVDGTAAERIFTPPMTGTRQRQGASPPEGGVAAPAARSWSSPFFPKAGTPAPPPAPPRHVLPASNPKPTRFRHFGHWHPAGTPPHTHQRGRPVRHPADGEAPS